MGSDEGNRVLGGRVRGSTELAGRGGKRRLGHGSIGDEGGVRAGVGCGADGCGGKGGGEEMWWEWEHDGRKTCGGRIEARKNTINVEFGGWGGVFGCFFLLCFWGGGLVFGLFCLVGGGFYFVLLSVCDSSTRPPAFRLLAREPLCLSAFVLYAGRSKS